MINLKKIKSVIYTGFIFGGVGSYKLTYIGKSPYDHYCVGAIMPPTLQKTTTDNKTFLKVVRKHYIESVMR
jgi:hypothetical protein